LHDCVTVQAFIAGEGKAIKPHGDVGKHDEMVLLVLFHQLFIASFLGIFL